jgi:hypothetical protein
MTNDERTLHELAEAGRLDEAALQQLDADLLPCSDCGRPIYYDTDREAYRHAADLVRAEADSPHLFDVAAALRDYRSALRAVQVATEEAERSLSDFVAACVQLGEGA